MLDTSKVLIWQVDFLRNGRKGFNLTTQISLLLLEAEWIFVKLNLSSRFVWVVYKRGEIVAQLA